MPPFDYPYFVWAVVLLGVFLAALAFHRGSKLPAALSALLAAMIAIGTQLVALLWLRSDLWPIPVAGGVGYAVFYFVFLRVAFAAWPEFRLQWNEPNLWGPAVDGVPLDEVAWGPACGTVWPLKMAYVFGARISPATTEAPTVVTSHRPDPDEFPGGN